jgi:disulfide bond formation protein DsbB
MNQTNQKSWYYLFVAWVITLISVLGSLFFSEVMNLPPCHLCWYQRVALFPLLPIFSVALWSFDYQVVKYSFLLIAIGWLFALYQNLMIWGLIPESIQPCSQGVSCTENHFDLGIITIPFLALIGFSVLGLCIYLLHRSSLQETHE